MTGLSTAISVVRRPDRRLDAPIQPLVLSFSRPAPDSVNARTHGNRRPIWPPVSCVRSG
jgi:hypothetical protein